MHPLKTFVLGTALAITLTSTGFALGYESNINSTSIECRERIKKAEIVIEKDILQKLENRKVKIQEKVSEGKISTEKANKIKARIDQRINKVKEISKLSPDKKKAALIADFKELMNKKVQNNRLTKEEADTLIKKYTEKVNSWDGNGYPILRHENHKEKH